MRHRYRPLQHVSNAKEVGNNQQNHNERAFDMSNKYYLLTYLVTENKNGECIKRITVGGSDMQ